VSEPGSARCTPSPAVTLDLAAIRETLLAGRNNLATRLRVAEMRITGRRVAEPSLEVFAKAFADLLAGAGLFPFLTSQQWHWAITDAQASGIDFGPFAALVRHDPAAVLADASGHQLRRARLTAFYLARYGEMLQGPAWMTSSQETADCRAYLKGIGVAPSLRYLARLMTLPRDAAVAIAACLDPWYSSLEELLDKKFQPEYGAPGQAAGGERDAQAAWLATISADEQPPPAVGRWVGSAYRKRRRRPNVY
jgi:hypothetical protein